ncbi:MAG: hypothetical protein K2Z81_18130, partial [Cyanobacteria bacterium]|nr:hypothetical protein [Cyanobacteriota bacterium]
MYGYDNDYSQEVGATSNEPGSAFGALLDEMYSDAALSLPKSDKSTSTVALNDLELFDNDMPEPVSVPESEDSDPAVSGEKNS